MAQGAVFTGFDIPYCPTTAKEIPKAIITWDEAKSIYKRKLRSNPDFTHDAFICFYMDDYKFDGVRGIWHDSGQALKIIRHFKGVITPDFSTYQDFPEPIKIYATYRMRLFGYWLGKNGTAVINNVRWGSPETWKYCYNGIDKNSIVAIGTVGGSPRKLIDRKRFENGLYKMVEAMISIKDNPRLKGSNPNLYTQFVLYVYYKSLGKAISAGVSYKKTTKVGNWEFAFAPARNGQKYPVVKHALFTGIEK